MITSTRQFLRAAGRTTTPAVRFRLCTALAVQLIAPLAGAAEIPAATRLQLRLTTAVSSQTSRIGNPIGAVLIAPVAVGTRVLPAGLMVTGAVSEVSAYSLDHQARLGLAFDRLTGRIELLTLAVLVPEILVADVAGSPSPTWSTRRSTSSAIRSSTT